MTDAMQKRLREYRSRWVIRAWQYRQRNHAQGVWFRFRRLLADAAAAYAISEEDADRLEAEGRLPEPVGRELAPERRVFVLTESRVRELASARPLAVRLSAELLAAPSLVLLPFPEPPSGAAPDSPTPRG